MGKNFVKSLLLSAFFLFFSTAAFANLLDKNELHRIYLHHSHQPSDIHQHVPVLRELASECSSVVEIGVRQIVSTWGILRGLADSPAPSRSYIGIDIDFPPTDTLSLASRLAEANGVSFQFWHANDMTVDFGTVDMLFIDSMHTYAHMTYELEKFSPKVTKYICMHDTSDPWGTMDQPYDGDYSEYPSFIDRTKRGLWPAVEDFLERHPEWTLVERRTNCHGFTILKRISA